LFLLLAEVVTQKTAGVATCGSLFYMQGFKTAASPFVPAQKTGRQTR
jgi:hypothetical protein